MATIVEKVVDAVTDLKESGADKVKDMTDEITNSQDIINKSGFKFHEIDVKLAIPPEVKAGFFFEKRISDEEREKILEETKEKTSLNLILKSLFKASDFYDSMKLGSFKLDVIYLSLGLTPGIGVKFVKVD